MTNFQQAIDEAADHYTDIELCGHSINEEHVHTAFSRGMQAGIRLALGSEEVKALSIFCKSPIVKAHYYKLLKEVQGE